MKTLFILVLAVLSNVSAFSQNVVTGIVKDNTGEVVPFATVQFYEGNNTTPETGKIADSSGAFKVQVKSTGSYAVKVSALGYRDTSIQFTVGSSQTIVVITMRKNDNYLAEVAVTANKPLISRRADRYILNVSESVLSKGRNTFDIMNYAPGVMTIGDNISINGNTATKVMIDGRMLHLSSEQVHNYLANLPSEEVASIEIIPVPGAEFDSEGGGGIINIVLKKNHTAGFTSSIGVGIHTPEWPSYNTRVQLNYRAKKIQVYASYYYNRHNTYSDFSDKRKSGTQTYETASHNQSDHHAGNYNFGIGYDFDKDHFLGVEFNGNNSRSESRTLTHSILDKNQNSQENINSTAFKRNNNDLYSASLNYNWNMDSLGSGFKFKADYTWADYYQSGDYRSRYNDMTDKFLFDSIYRNQVPVNIDNYDVSVDYNKKWGKKNSFKLGGKYTHTHTINDIHYQNLQQNDYVNDPTRSNMFDYTEGISGVYAEYSKQWENTAMQIGMRGEQTATTGISSTLDTSFEHNYFNLFPSAFIKHDFNDKHSVSLSYSRRLDRPGFTILNPFELRVDDYSYVKGNPGLLPQYTHSIQLSYLFHQKCQLTLFTQLTDDPFGQPLANEAGNSIVSKYIWKNMKYDNAFGANLYLPVTVTKWWSMINNFLVYQDKIGYDRGHNSKTIFRGKTIQNITIEKNWRLELSGFYQSSYNLANLIFVPKYYVDIGLHKSFLNDKLDASFLVTDLFNTQRMDYHSDNNAEIMLSAKQKYLSRQLIINLTYHFKTGKKIKIQKIKAGNEEEKSRM